MCFLGLDAPRLDLLFPEACCSFEDFLGFTEILGPGSFSTELNKR